MMLTNSTLRQIWLIIEQTQARILLELSDSELVQSIQERLKAGLLIPDSELNAAGIYLESKVSLIRDLAESRLANA